MRNMKKILELNRDIHRQANGLEWVLLFSFAMLFVPAKICAEWTPEASVISAPLDSSEAVIVNSHSTVNANTYYLSPDGKDSNNGQSLTTPWRTYRHAFASLRYGDVLYIRAGIYSDLMLFYGFRSGGAGENDRITIKAYENEKVIITTMQDISGTGNWTGPDADGIYEYVYSDSYHRHNFSVDGIPQRLVVAYNNHSAGKSDIINSIFNDGSEGLWSRNKDDKKIWFKPANGVDFNSLEIKTSRATSTINMPADVHYITFEGITIEGGYYAILMRGDHIILDSCELRNAFADAIKIDGYVGSGTPWDSEYGIIDNCNIYNFGESGIDITGGDYFTVSNTKIHDGKSNRHNGTKVNGLMMKNNSMGNVVRNNEFYDLETRLGAITIGGTTINNDQTEGYQIVVEDNIIHNTSGPYIVAFMGAQENTLHNNLIYNCKASEGGRELIVIRHVKVDGVDILTSDNTITNNAFYKNVNTFTYNEATPNSLLNTIINNYTNGGSNFRFYNRNNTINYDTTDIDKEQFLNVFETFLETDSVYFDELLEYIKSGGGPSAVEENGSHLIKEFDLCQNHPNPFNPETTIGYVLEKNAHVTITVFNLLGEKINELENRDQSAGRYTCRWGGSDFTGHQTAAGIYIYRMTVVTENGASFMQSRKMALVR